MRMGKLKVLATCRCTMWHTPVAGDVCSGIIARSDGLDLADFYHLNPSVSSDCSDLQIGLAYCIDTDGALCIRYELSLSDS